MATLELQAAGVDSFEVFVGQLPVDLSKNDLHDLFRGCGHINDCFIGKKPHEEAHFTYGFVRFSKLESALRAVKERNGWPVGFRQLRVELTKATKLMTQRDDKSECSDDQLNLSRFRKYVNEVSMSPEDIQKLYRKIEKEPNMAYQPVVLQLTEPNWTMSEIDSLVKERNASILK